MEAVLWVEDSWNTVQGFRALLWDLDGLLSAVGATSEGCVSVLFRGFTASYVHYAT